MQPAAEFSLPRAMDLDPPAAGALEGPAAAATNSPRPPPSQRSSDNGKPKRQRHDSDSGSHSTLSPTSSMAEASHPDGDDEGHVEVERVSKRASWDPETSSSSRDTPAPSRTFSAGAFTARPFSVSAPGGGAGAGGCSTPTAVASPSSAMRQVREHAAAAADDCEMLPPQQRAQQPHPWQQLVPARQQQQQQQQRHNTYAGSSSASTEEDRMRCQAELATTKMIGGSGAVISQDVFLEAIQGGSCRDAAEVFEFRWPRERQASRASTILNLNQKQHGIMYALAGCSDVMYVMSRVKAPVREALQKLYDIDKVNFYTWFKNRRLPLKRLMVRHVAKTASLAALKAAASMGAGGGGSDDARAASPPPPPAPAGPGPLERRASEALPSSRPPLQSRHSMPLLRAATQPLPALPSELLRPRLSLGQQPPQRAGSGPAPSANLGGCISQLLLQHTSQPLLHPQSSALQFLSLPMQQHLSMPLPPSDAPGGSRDSRSVVLLSPQQQQQQQQHLGGGGGHGEPLLCVVPRLSGEGGGQQGGQQYAVSTGEGQYQLVTSFAQCQSPQGGGGGARWAAGPAAGAGGGALRGGICMQQLMQQHAAAQQQQQQQQQPRLMLQTERGVQPILYLPQLVYLPEGYTVVSMPPGAGGSDGGPGGPQASTSRRSA